MSDKHVVHEIHRPQGHGYVDQKYGKGNRSPVGGQVPYVDTHDVDNHAAGDSFQIPTPDLGAATPMIQPAVDAYNSGARTVENVVGKIKGYFGK